MAVPKRRMSRSRTRSRRAQWKARPVPLSEVVIDGERRLVPTRLVAAYRRGLLP
ncbi:MAG: 50S ribosomal protein L32 [Angustibacter sp.]